MIEIYLKTERDTEFNRITHYCDGCFIYVKQATLDDLDQIDQLVSHQIGDLHSSIDKYEIPRLEKHDDNLLLFARHPGEQEAGLHTETLTLILTKHHLIAISPYMNPIIEHILLLNPNVTTEQKTEFLLYLLMRIGNQYTTSIKQVRHSILLHENPAQMINSDAIIALTKNEEVLNQYLTALVPMRNLLEGLTSHHYLELSEKEKDELQETLIGISQSEELCRVNVKSIRSLRDSYQIIFTNDVSKTIKRLTAITIIISIPTMIASVYGMNIAIPFQHDPRTFLILAGVTVSTCVLATLLFIKKRWL